MDSNHFLLEREAIQDRLESRRQAFMAYNQRENSTPIWQSSLRALMHPVDEILSKTLPSEVFKGALAAGVAWVLPRLLNFPRRPQAARRGMIHHLMGYLLPAAK